MSMEEAIHAATIKFSMNHIMTQLEDAMLEGKHSLTFKRRDDQKPPISLPTGEMHFMQAVRLSREGWTVERSSGVFTISGWGDTVTV